MKGGMREVLLDFTKKQASFASNLFLGTLILGITFYNEIPKVYVNQADTLLGRLFMITFLFFVLDMGGWLQGILVTIFFGLLLSVSTRPRVEGFKSDQEIRIVPEKKLWFVEETLKETPIAIEDEKVRTSAVQDNNAQQYSPVQDSKSSSR
jgi:hypothetical protein